jgi:hypothetical protein
VENRLHIRVPPQVRAFRTAPETGTRLVDVSYSQETGGVDLVLKTLEVQRGSRVIKVVTSHNPLFAENKSRKQLLDLIKAIEKSLAH